MSDAYDWFVSVSDTGALHVAPPSVDVEPNRPSGQPVVAHWIPPKNTASPVGAATIAGLSAAPNARATVVIEPTFPDGLIDVCSTLFVTAPPGSFRVQTTCSTPSLDRAASGSA